MYKVIFRQVFAAIIIILTLITYLSCGEDAVTDTQNDSFCISGQISNWTLGAKTLHAYLRNKSGLSFSIANCPIDANGNFNLCPPSAPDSTLYASDSIFYSGCSGGTVTFNPSDVRGTEILTFKVKSGDTAIGYIRNNNYTVLAAGSFSITYIWVTKNVTVTGWKKCGSDSLFFNGSAVTNWNKIVKNYTRVSTSGNTILYNNTEPSGAIWKYTSY